MEYDKNISVRNVIIGGYKMETAKIIVGVIHILLSIAIIALILLQSGKQAGLSGAIGGAAESFFGKNKSRTMDAMLARFTRICAVGFLITSLFLAYGDTLVNDTAPIAETEIAPVEGDVVPVEGDVVPVEGDVVPVEGETVPAAE